MILQDYFSYLENVSWRWSGRVTRASGQIVESDGPFCSVGECCEIAVADGKHYPGEIIGFRGPSVLSMSLDKPTGIRYGDRCALCRGLHHRFRRSPWRSSPPAFRPIVRGVRSA